MVLRMHKKRDPVRVKMVLTNGTKPRALTLPSPALQTPLTAQQLCVPPTSFNNRKTCILAVRRKAQQYCSPEVLYLFFARVWEVWSTHRVATSTLAAHALGASAAKNTLYEYDSRPTEPYAVDT